MLAYRVGHGVNGTVEVMSHLHRGLAVLALIAAGGCSGRVTTAVRSSGLLTTHCVGGVHHRMIVHDGVWFQTFGSSLLVIDPSTADVLDTVELIEQPSPGPAGPAVEMVLSGRRLLVVIEDTAVVELDTGDPRRPAFRARVDAAQLGIAPRAASLAGGELFISGRGGVVRWSDRQVVLTRPDVCGRVASAAGGLGVCAGRRVYRLADGSYLGSASDLQPLPDAFGIGRGLLFVRQGAGAAQVGLMTGDIREVDVDAATVSVDGTVHRARIIGDRIWVVTDEGLTGFTISGDRLLDRKHHRVAGARDADAIDRDHLAVAGVFGRAVIGPETAGVDPAVLLHAHRVPAGFTRARRDGRYIVAGGAAGTWQYEAGGPARPSGDSPGDEPAADTVRAIHGGATIDAGGRSVTISSGAGDLVHAEPAAVRILALAVVGGDLWMGHERGITVVGFDGTEKGRLWLNAPVRYVFPWLDGRGAAWAGEGGFGAAGLSER